MLNSDNHESEIQIPRECKSVVPFSIITVSLLQILLFAIHIDYNIERRLRFEPNKITQVWRFITYMFQHETWIHLYLNVFLQILFAYFLERRHGSLRVTFLYFIGGITAVLGASCFTTDMIIGASGGVYALLLSHISDVLMDMQNIKHKKERVCSVVIIVLFDVVYNVAVPHFHTSLNISWQTHVVGGISGFFLGLVFFKKQCAKTRQLFLFWTGFIMYGILFVLLVLLAVEIRRCTPRGMDYVYFC